MSFSKFCFFTCNRIIDVQNLLTKEQREKVSAYVGIKKTDKVAVTTENNSSSK